MPMFSNPFFVGGPVPPKYFVGRNSQIRIAFDQINKCAHAAFYGSSGIGKSSFVKFLSVPEVWQEMGIDISKFYIVSLNCKGITPFTSEKFWGELVSILRIQVAGNLEIETAINDLRDADVGQREFRQLVGIVGAQKKLLLLLLDDFDWTLTVNKEYDDSKMLSFLNEFRNLAVHSDESQYLSTVITSFRNIAELGPSTSCNSGSPWYNHYLVCSLPSFDRSEVEKHFFNSESPLFIPMDSKLKSSILGITYGNPCLLQIAGYLIHNIYQDEKTPNIRIFSEEFFSRANHFFKNTWERSTEKERVLLMLIALKGVNGRLNNQSYDLNDLDRILSQNNQKLLDLKARDIIKQIDSKPLFQYVFSSSMMELWVLREIENTGDKLIEKREKILLNLMSREQFNNVKNLLQRVWKEKESVTVFLKQMIS